MPAPPKVLANRIEMIQEVLYRAAQFVHLIPKINSYYYSASVAITSMLESLGWLTLQARRNCLKLLLTYKIIKAMISIAIATI